MNSLKEIKNVFYPNPYLRRDGYILLDGKWDCSFSKTDEIPSNFDLKVIVPFPIESKASGIGEETLHESIWYQKEIDLRKTNKRILINFLGSDYETIVFVNGVKVGSHVGCYTSFLFDITDYICDGKNVISIHVKDSFAKDQLRGKQRTRGENYECWYVQTSGICRSVYLDFVDDTYLTNVLISSNNNGDICINLETNSAKPYFHAILRQGKNVIKVFEIISDKTNIHIDHPLLWNIDHPNLYDLDLVSETITTSTSFGFKEIETKNRKIFINGKEEYLKMILDQGYWKESLSTTPSLEALYKDIVLIKSMGFNGVRKHQKIEDYRFYYLCDFLGLYVFGEIPSCYEFTSRMCEEVRRDIPLIQKALFNSPSIVVWLLFNESWGISGIRDNAEINEFVKEIFDLMLPLKNNRLVITNDGWNQTSETDILSLHEYEQDGSKLIDRYSDLSKLLSYQDINHFGPAFNIFSKYSNQPVIFSEFGGVSCSNDGWGYGEKATSENYIIRIKDVFKAMHSFKYLSGYCYTQLTDVQQETNGLLTIDREPKISIEIIREIVKGGFDNEKH